MSWRTWRQAVAAVRRLYLRSGRGVVIDTVGGRRFIVRAPRVRGN